MNGQLVIDFNKADATGRDGGHDSFTSPAKALGASTPEGQTCRPVATAPHRKARTTDPATSKRAALAVAPRAGSQRSRVLAAILAAPNGRTYDEVAEATGIVGVSVSTRISELAAAGLVERRGERLTSAGGSAAICFPTDLARGSVAA